MFQIKKYLQFKNTPNGKPRVLTENEDYNTIFDDSLYAIHSSYELTDANWIKSPVADLKDCRLLLSIEYLNRIFTDCDIFIDNLGKKEIAYFSYGLTSVPKPMKSNLPIVGSFFDDPAQYSKLLWNCSEEEGWEKVLKLLNI
jgi:hypothetical protein